MAHSFWCKTLIFKLILSAFIMTQSAALFCSQQSLEIEEKKKDFDRGIKSIKEKIGEINRLSKEGEEPTPENNKKLGKLRNDLLKLIREKSKLNSPEPQASELVSGEKVEGEGCQICRKIMKKDDSYTFHIHKHIKQKQKMDGNNFVKDKDGKVVMEDELDTQGHQQEVATSHTFHKDCLWTWFTTSGTNAALCPSCGEDLPNELEKLFESYTGDVTPRLFLIFCRTGLITLVKKCLKKDPSLATCYEPDTEITPLHEAAAGGHIELVKLLIGNDARPTLYDAAGMRPYDLVPLDNVELKKLLNPTRLQAWNNWLIKGCDNHRLWQYAQDGRAQLICLGLEFGVSLYGTVFFRPKSWRIIYEGLFGTKLRALCTTTVLLGVAGYLGSYTDRGGSLLNRMAPSWFDDPVELRQRKELLELYRTISQARWGAANGYMPPSRPVMPVLAL